MDSHAQKTESQNFHMYPTNMSWKKYFKKKNTQNINIIDILTQKTNPEMKRILGLMSICDNALLTFKDNNTILQIASDGSVKYNKGTAS